ncbi:MAG: hypothetical protein LAO78_04130 [Acidobacteriia bacterium]|nr:hypothetical protein [Terriglobia bacterium]
MTELTPRQRNWAPWAGLLLALAALFSNAGFFLGLPGDKLIPMASLVLAIAALVCAVVGVMRAFRQPQVYGGKISSPILGVLSLLICALAGVASIHSRDLPAAGAAPQVGQKVPAFALADTNGAPVSLAQLLGKGDGAALAMGPNAAGSPANVSASAAPKAVLLIFYRGYW